MNHYTNSSKGHEIVEGLIIGKSALANDPKLGITHVVVCAEMRHLDLAHHLKRILVPASNTKMLDDAMIESTCKYIQTSIRERGRVLLCCDQGLSWSPGVAIAYVMQTKNLGVFEAYLAVRERYFALRPTASVFNALFDWEKKSVKPEAVPLAVA